MSILLKQLRVYSSMFNIFKRVKQLEERVSRLERYAAYDIDFLEWVQPFLVKKKAHLNADGFMVSYGEPVKKKRGRLRKEK